MAVQLSSGSGCVHHRAAGKNTVSSGPCCSCGACGWPTSQAYLLGVWHGCTSRTSHERPGCTPGDHERGPGSGIGQNTPYPAAGGGNHDQAVCRTGTQLSGHEHHGRPVPGGIMVQSLNRTPVLPPVPGRLPGKPALPVIREPGATYVRRPAVGTAACTACHPDWCGLSRAHQSRSCAGAGIACPRH